MKYLLDDTRTPSTLQAWSSPQKLVMAHYFFWINGTDLQRSLEGLLRSLLYDILRHDLKSVKDLLPEAWMLASDYYNSSSPSSIVGGSLDWSQGALLDAFRRLPMAESMSTKLCFFIDGLDEYHGDHDNLVHTLTHLTKAGAKLCVASRPWNVFEEAFGAETTRKLYLEELNRKDIQRYVNEKLRGHQNFPQIDREEADDIVNEIIDKSQGVFLWVWLAVRSLVEGLRNRDSLVLLRTRLLAFPNDLDQFFRHMFDSLDAIYRPRLSHMFQVALAAGRPLSLVAYWFLDEIDDRPAVPPTPSAFDRRTMDLKRISEDMKFRINGRSRGLLEVTKEYHSDCALGPHSEEHTEPRVDFLHRTVKDFIMTTGIQKMLKEWQQPHFDADMTLCHIAVAEYKTRVSDDAEKLKYLLEMFLIAGSRVEKGDPNSRKPIEAYTAELEQAVAEHVQSRPSNPWHLLDSYSMLCALLKYDMRRSFARIMEGKSLSWQEKIECLEVLQMKRDAWSNSATTNHDMTSLLNLVSLLLSQSHPIKTDESFLHSILTQMEQLD